MPYTKHVGDTGNQEFPGLPEAAPDAMNCVERDGRIVLICARAVRLLGYLVQELAGEPIELLVLEAGPAYSRAAASPLRNACETAPDGAGTEPAACREDGTSFRPEFSCPATGCR